MLRPATARPGQYVGRPQLVSTRPLVVSPGLQPHQPRNQPPPPLTASSYSDRYGWSQAGLNWTSLAMAKPVWEEEEDFSSLDRADQVNTIKLRAVDCIHLNHKLQIYFLSDT